MAARISGKLTAKSLGFDRGVISEGVKTSQRLSIGRIVGIVSGLHQTVSEESGEIQTGLKGTFKGVSALNNFEPVMETVNIDGKDVERPKRDANDKIITRDTGDKITMTAGRCYLPGGIQDMIEGAYAQAVESDAKATVQFAVDLFAIPSTNKAGYSFDADMLIEASEVDPLDALMTAAAAKALPAPEAHADEATTLDTTGGAAATTKASKAK